MGHGNGVIENVFDRFLMLLKNTSSILSRRCWCCGFAGQINKQKTKNTNNIGTHLKWIQTKNEL